MQQTIISSMAVQPDGKIVLGGTFLNFNGEPRANLARIYADGSLDMSFAPMTQNVYDVKLMPDGKIIVSGNVQTIDNIPQRYITRLNPNAFAAPFLEIHRRNIDLNDDFIEKRFGNVSHTPFGNSVCNLLSLGEN